MRKPITKKPAPAKPKAKVLEPAARAAAPKPRAKPKPPPAVAKLAAAKPKEVVAPHVPMPDAAMPAKPKDKPGKATSKGRTEPLNFRVTADFRRAFKRAAAAQDCKKVELLERLFTEWAARNPA